MSRCIVLPDAAVQELLISQSRDETIVFLDDMRTTLKSYAVGEERKHQPDPDVVVRPTGQKTLFRPFTAPETVGTKIVVDPAPDQNGKKPPLHGVLVLCDDKGSQTGVINAAEVTGYRTSLNAMVPYMMRKHTSNLVVFGAGKQALWHSRLALVLRGTEIKTITIVNRSEDRGNALLEQLKSDNTQRWKSEAKLACVHEAQPDYEETFEKLLSEADVVFCTVPSTKPLFESKHIIQRRPESDQPLISAIGSYQPDMIEVPPDLIKSIVNDPKGHGVLVVDDRTGCSAHAGEVVQCGLQDEQMVEIGAILDQKEGTAGRQTAAFEEWLRTGLVVYKSCGVGVTDLMAGQRLLELAKAKDLGVKISEF